MSHTNPLPERLRASADEVQSFPHPSFCDHLHVAHDVMREAAAALEAYDLGARSTAAQPADCGEAGHSEGRCGNAGCTKPAARTVETLTPDVVEQRLLTWRQRHMNRSGDRLALDDFMDKESLDDLIDVVCAPPAASGGIPSLSADGDPAARVELPTRTLMERRGIASMASQQTSTSVANEGAGCVETLAGSRPTVSTQQCNAAASGDSTPPSVQPPHPKYGYTDTSNFDSSSTAGDAHNNRKILAERAQFPGDPSGALRPEPEAAEEGMPGLLKAMRWAYDNFYVKGYSNGDEREGYISALEDDLPVLFGQVDDLVALVARLARSLRKAAPADALSDRALDYLRRKGLNPSPLRTAEPPHASGERGD